MNFLMVHGNGGAESRFELFRRLVEAQKPGNLRLVFPKLPGFSGRSLPDGAPSWEPFLESLSKEILARPDEPWCFYGHGIGGSLLLEWAARNWEIPGRSDFHPRQVILHGCIGASLERRFFPILMRPLWVRHFVKWLICHPLLKPAWEKKLFLYPDRIPEEVRIQFFEDYKTCQAFPVFFDLITPEWYNRVREVTGGQRFLFLWGEKERVIASRHLSFWKKDFPESVFKIIPEWDHFPMLDQPESFYEALLGIAGKVPVEHP